jgi:hypothetical protein
MFGQMKIAVATLDIGSRLQFPRDLRPASRPESLNCVQEVLILVCLPSALDDPWIQASYPALCALGSGSIMPHGLCDHTPFAGSVE